MKWLLAGAAVIGGYLALSKPARFLGDKAQIGDDVFLPVGLGPPIQGIPAGTGQIMVHVTTIGPDTVSGPVTGYSLAGAANFLMLPAPTPPVPIARNSIVGISRNGTTVS
jgi:hypothetical protein